MGWQGLESGFDYIQSEVDKVPEKPGIYLICENSSGYPKLRYIGMSESLKNRLQQHLEGNDKEYEDKNGNKTGNQGLYNFMKAKRTIANREDKAFFFWLTEDEDKAKEREAFLLNQCHNQEGYDLFNQQGAGDGIVALETPLPESVERAKSLGNLATPVKKA